MESYSNTIIELDPVITQEILHSICEHPQASPAFRVWLMRMAANEDLELIIRAVIRSGKASDVLGALEFIRDLSQNLDYDKVRDRDLTDKHPAVLGKLRNFFCEAKPDSLSQLVRRYGTNSHGAIQALYKGRLPDYEAAQYLLRGGNMDNQQVALFDDGQLELFGLESHHESELLKEILPGNRISPSLRCMVTDCWRVMKQALQSSKKPLKQYERGRPMLEEMIRLLRPIFGAHLVNLLRPLAGRRDSDKLYLLMLTLETWATALIKKPLLGPAKWEVPILRFQDSSIGGRCDAIEFVGVNGCKPKRRELQAFQDLGQELRSVGELASALDIVLPGRRVELKITDQKFAVGDSTDGKVLLTSQIVKEPLPSHLRQVERYLMLSQLAAYLENNQSDRLPWRDETIFRQGRFVYMMPGRIIVHNFELEPEQAEHLFRAHVISRWDKAELAAQERTISNRVLRLLCHELEGKRPRSRSWSNNGKEITSELPISGPTETRFKALIKSQRRYLDPLEIVEVRSSRSGKPQNVMFLSKLFLAMNQGLIPSQHWTLHSGGKISCPNPEHDDSTPSCQIYMKDGRFYCFACGTYGSLDYSLTPHDFSMPVSPSVRKRLAKTKTVVIPPRHYQVMDWLEKELQKGFPGSLAEKYLAKTRCLDADLAFELGAGWGRNRVIANLLDQGVSFEEMIDLGMVGFSPKVGLERGLGPMLRRRGFKEEQIKRQISPKVFGYPYFALDGRATFPLFLGNGISNFYGRATYPCDRSSSHRKLKNEKTRVPHGAFNLAALQPGTSRCFLTEGVMDALALMMIGKQGHELVSSAKVVALIGILNYVVLEAVVLSHPGEIYLALDRDKSGLELVTKVRNHLASLGYPEENIFNFSADYFPNLPGDWQDCKDYADVVKKMSNRS